MKDGSQRRKLQTHWQRLYNPVVIWVLRSPFHGLMSGSTMLLSYKGRKSGRTYVTLINYAGMATSCWP